MLLNEVRERLVSPSDGGMWQPCRPNSPTPSQHMPCVKSQGNTPRMPPRPGLSATPQNLHTQSVDALGRTETGQLSSTVHSKTQYTPHHLLTLSQEQAARAAKSCQQLPGCAVSCVVWRYKLSHKDQRSHSSDTQREPAQEALQRSAQLQDHTTTTACSCRTGLLLLLAAPTSTSF